MPGKRGSCIIALLMLQASDTEMSSAPKCDCMMTDMLLGNNVTTDAQTWGTAEPCETQLKNACLTCDDGMHLEITTESLCAKPQLCCDSKDLLLIFHQFVLVRQVTERGLLSYEGYELLLEFTLLCQHLTYLLTNTLC